MLTTLLEAGSGSSSPGDTYAAEQGPGSVNGDAPACLVFEDCPILAELGIYISVPKTMPAGGDPPVPDAGPAPIVTSASPVRQLRGHVDLLRRNLVEGWAMDEASPGQPVPLVIVVDGTEVARGVAGRYREDLEAAGIGTGEHGFSIPIPWLSDDIPHVVAVRRALDGRDLVQSPGAIDPSTYFDPAFEQNVTRVLESLQDEVEQAHAISFLMAQASKLQRRRAVSAPPLTPLPSAVIAQPQPVPPPLPGPRALVIDNAMPPIEETPASQAILAHMRALQAMNYTVSFVVAHGPTPVDRAAAALEAKGIECFRPPYFVSVDEVLKRLNDAIDAVYFHRVPNVAHHLALVRQYLPKARIFFRVTPPTNLHASRPARGEGIQWTEIDADWPGNAAPGHLPVEAALLRHATRDAGPQRTVLSRGVSRRGG